jgi:hypothetical protein
MHNNLGIEASLALTRLKLVRLITRLEGDAANLPTHEEITQELKEILNLAYDEPPPNSGGIRNNT